MKRFRSIEYLSGFTNPKIPRVGKRFMLEINADGITIWHQSLIYSRHKEVIPLSHLTNVKSFIMQSRRSLSAGKAVVGTILLPGVGTIVGAAMGGKRKDYSLIISHIEGGRQIDLELITKQCEQIEQAILGTLKESGITLSPAKVTDHAGSSTYIEEIEKLAALRDKSIITEQEFQTQKQRLLEKLN